MCERFVEINKPVWALRGLGGTASAIRYRLRRGQRRLDFAWRAVSATAFPFMGRFEPGAREQLGVPGRRQRTRGPVDNYDVGDPGVEEMSPVYSIWLYDMTSSKRRADRACAAGPGYYRGNHGQNRTRANVIFDKVDPELNGGWEDDNVGVVNITQRLRSRHTTFNGCFFNLCGDLVDAAETVSINSVAGFCRSVERQRQASAGALRAFSQGGRNSAGRRPGGIRISTTTRLGCSAVSACAKSSVTRR